MPTRAPSRARHLTLRDARIVVSGVVRGLTSAYLMCDKYSVPHTRAYS